MKQTQSERRKYLRIGDDFVLSCEEYSIPRIKKQFKAVSKDLSAGGLLISTLSPFDLGTVLRFEISMTGWHLYKPEFRKADAKEDSPLIALGTVVRVEHLTDGSYEIGVRLDGVDEGHRMALEKYVKSHAKDARA